MGRSVVNGGSAAAVAVLVGSARALTPAGAADQPGPAVPMPLPVAVARQTLPSGDGWAFLGTGTTGGSTAGDDHIFVVHNRSELVAALGGDNATNAKNTVPKTIFVDGHIGANVDDAKHPLA
jgi:pectate lyase